MALFFICVALLLASYWFYSPFVEKQAGIDVSAQTPQQRFNDGIDYVAIHPIKAFLIQFLNVAGIGPILGALYGPVALIWIVVGNILGGAVHDYFSGVLSIKEDGKSLPEIAKHYFNNYAKVLMLVFTSMLLFFVGVVFILGPAGLLSNIDSFQGTMLSNNSFWVIAILCYYFLATLLPIDKIITKLYPVFGLLMIFMTLAIASQLLIKAPLLPELGDVLAVFSHDHFHLLNNHPSNLPIWPLLFVTITCGAISGFHSTQAPIMARCLSNEKYVRPVYYGAMMSEGLVACVWALAGMAAFPGGYEQLSGILAQGGPALVVKEVATGFLGGAGSLLAIVAVAVFPITSGDTAFRSLRLTLVDAFNIPQGLLNRILLATPILLIAYAMTFVEFSLIWRYFAFSNMLLSTSVLWLASRYIFINGKLHWLASLPALVGTAISLSYILQQDIGFALAPTIAKVITAGVCALALIGLVAASIKQKRYNASKA